MSWTDLENNYNEFNGKIFSLFQINIEDLLKNKFEWMVQHKIPTTVTDTWYYWEFEQYVKLLNERNKEENEQHEKQNKDQGEKYSNFNPSSMAKQYNPSNMMKNFQSGNNLSFPRI
jgi:hypothetical protein